MGFLTKPAGLSWAPWLTGAVLAGPVIAGLLGTALPAFGGLVPGASPLLPKALTLAAWHQALAEPGLTRALWLSAQSGIVATALALCLALCLVAGGQRVQARRRLRGLEAVISPLLSLPHAAAALGLAFLIAPSGVVARLLSPWATGWHRPPDLLLLQDPNGWALTLGLAAKELPFLLLMILAALPQCAPQARARVAAGLGYSPLWGWCATVLPALYPQIRMPIYAVLAYGASNVDMALILGPATPPTLAVLVLEAMTHPDLAQRAPGAAMALMQLGLVIGLIGLWALAERLMARLGRLILWCGHRGSPAIDRAIVTLCTVLTALATAALFAGLLAHLLWSFAGRWRFPATLPEPLSLRVWSRQGGAIWETGLTTLALALAAAGAALLLSLACLEHEQRRAGRPAASRALWLLYLPLLLPQVSFVPGLQIFLLQFGAGHGWGPLFLSHLVFVLPYVFLSLAGPYRAWNTGYGRVGAALAASASGVFWRLRLPMLLRPVLTALAVGMAVSIGQYLPTLLASGGRISTLTTEALALSAGGDRRVIGAWALALTVAAWAPFVLAMALPSLLYRNRKGISHG